MDYFLIIWHAVVNVAVLQPPDSWFDFCTWMIFFCILSRVANYSRSRISTVYSISQVVGQGCETGLWDRVGGGNRLFILADLS